MHGALRVLLLLTMLVTWSSLRSAIAQENDGKLRIIVFGGHPDDAEYKAGGTAAKWAKLGHHVKLVSVTNGDIGHWKMSGGALAKRRAAESKRAAESLAPSRKCSTFTTANCCRRWKIAARSCA